MYLPIFVVVVGNFFTVAGTVVVTTLVLSGCGNCGKCANWGCGAAFQYSVVVTGLVVTSSLLFQFKIFLTKIIGYYLFECEKLSSRKLKKPGKSTWMPLLKNGQFNAKTHSKSVKYLLSTSFVVFFTQTNISLKFDFVFGKMMKNKYLITSCQPLFESTSSDGLGHASYSLALSSSDLKMNIFIINLRGTGTS